MPIHCQIQIKNRYKCNEENCEYQIGDERARETWETSMVFIQIIWCTGEIVVLLSKGKDKYHGIVLLEPFWKTLEHSIDVILEGIPLS